MMKVNLVHDVKKTSIKDKKGVNRQLKYFFTKGNLYLGPVASLFNRTFVMKDKHRLEFISKLDTQFNELLHVSVLFEKMDEHPEYSYFDKDTIIQHMNKLGYTQEDFELKPKIYTVSKEMFIEYGFNSMNFCLDRKGDMWVHYKFYEEQKQYRLIFNALTKEQIPGFESEYKKMIRYVRYIDTKDINNPKGFVLKSINISKLYHWLKDRQLLHKVLYVADIYNECERELDFHEDVKNGDPFLKVVVDKDGMRLKDLAMVSNA